MTSTICHTPDEHASPGLVDDNDKPAAQPDASVEPRLKLVLDLDLDAYANDVSLDDPQGDTDGPSVERAVEWLKTHKPAIQGQGGRRTTWQAVQRVIFGFWVEQSTAAELLLAHYNPRCQPPWDADDIREMCRDAVGQQQDHKNELDPVLLDTAYRIILGEMPLYSSDREQLRQRGLSDEEIERAGYRSWAMSIDRRKQLLQQVEQAVGAEKLYRIPGIYRTDFGPELSLKGEGQGVPVRDQAGRIVGIRVRVVTERRNKKGEPILKDGKPIIDKKYLWLSGRKGRREDARRSACCHHPLHDELDLTTAVVTEGEFKADIGTWRRSILHVSIPGVGQWKLGLAAVQQLGVRKLGIAHDAEADRNKAVAESIIKTYEGALEMGMEVFIDHWPPEAGKGIDDVLTAGNADQIATLMGDEAEAFVERLSSKHKLGRKMHEGPPAYELLDEQEQPSNADECPKAIDWKSKLLMTKKTGPRNVTRNVEIVLRYHPAFRKALAYDEFNVGVAWGKKPPWVKRYPETAEVARGTMWDDDDDTRMISFLNTIQIDVSEKMVRNVARLVSKTQRYHPVREYLEGLNWDGAARVPSWLSTYMGAAQSDYATKAGTWWFIQAVRRIFKPGSMAKYILTLEGDQDIGKSSALRALAPSWFSDSRLDVGSLAGQLGLKGIWIWELAEAEILKRADRQALKGYIGQCSDHYTPKYANHPVTIPRQTVFAMSVNPEGGGYLSDPTGNVRFWTVACSPVGGRSTVDIDGIERDRDQLWAEAVQLYRQGDIPEPRSQEDKALFGEEVEERVQVDPWEVPISEAVEGKIETWVEHILASVLDIPAKSQKRGDQLRVAAVLKGLGWTQEKTKKVRDGKRVRLYVRDGQPAEPAAMSEAETTAATALTDTGWSEVVLPDGRRVLTQPEPDLFDDDEGAEIIELMNLG